MLGFSPARRGNGQIHASASVGLASARSWNRVPLFGGDGRMIGSDMMSPSRARVARDERVGIGQDLPRSHRERRVYAVIGSTETQLEMKVLEPLWIEWTEADDPNRLTGTDALFLAARRWGNEKLV